MATVRASCEKCGDVELTTHDVSVRICTDDSSGTYSFRCPDCDLVVIKTAEPQIIELLVASGVRLETWRLPAELTEIHLGPSIDHDDLLDFHDLLNDDARLAAELGRLVEG